MIARCTDLDPGTGRICRRSVKVIDSGILDKASQRQSLKRAGV